MSTKKVSDKDDPMPSRYRYARLSERNVRDDVYKALANLSGERLSPLESVKAAVDVASFCLAEPGRSQEKI